MTPTVSYILPAHNAEAVLASAVDAIAARLGGDRGGHQVVIVENASTDATRAVAERIARDRSGGTLDVVVSSSSKGMGLAYRRGIELATGEVLVLTAADLPFGVSDLDAYLALDPLPQLAIGSKAHPQSIVDVPLSRRVMTRAFFLLRRAALGLPAGDTQGTLLLSRRLAASLLPQLTSAGYLVSTEIVHLAHLAGIEAVELPVVYPRPQSASTVSPLRDSLAMAAGVIRLRGRRATPGARAVDPLLPEGEVEGASRGGGRTAAEPR